MSVGSNIRQLRERKGISQKDLSDVLNVTPQAVSRWENDVVEPSLETLRSLSDYFQISLDKIIQGSEETNASSAGGKLINEENPKTPKAKEGKKANVVAHELVGICARCGNAVYSDEDYGHGDKEVCQRTGRADHGTYVVYSYDRNVSAGNALFCSSCCNELEGERQKAIEAKHIEAKKKNRRGKFWGIVAMVLVGIGLITAGAISMSQGRGAIGGWCLGLSPVLGYLAFALVYVLFADNSFVSDVFMGIVSFGFAKMPGVIFSLDFDGVVFLIAAKILFAILSFCLSVLALAVAIVFAGIFACFVYPSSRRELLSQC